MFLPAHSTRNNACKVSAGAGARGRAHARYDNNFFSNIQYEFFKFFKYFREGYRSLSR